MYCGVCRNELNPKSEKLIDSYLLVSHLLLQVRNINIEVVKININILHFSNHKIQKHTW